MLEGPQPQRHPNSSHLHLFASCYLPSDRWSALFLYFIISLLLYPSSYSYPPSSLSSASPCSTSPPPQSTSSALASSHLPPCAPSHAARSSPSLPATLPDPAAPRRA